jgi:hypothetical protein
MHPWRDHPQLRGRFHSEAPDDLQVIVHDGGPRSTDRVPEAVWVTVTDCTDDGVFTGRVLNRPQQLKTVAQNDQIKFVATAGERLLMVTDKYLAERPSWIVHPCARCGLNELFDAPSELIRVIFSDLPAGASVDAFTSFCGACGGVQIVRDKNVEIEGEPPAKKWWQFWK